MGLISKLAWVVLPSLAGCGVLSQFTGQGAGTNPGGNAKRYQALNQFLCFQNSDVVGQQFQKYFSSRDGLQARYDIDIGLESIAPRLTGLLSSINRSNIESTRGKFESVVTGVIENDFKDSSSLAKAILAARACTLWAALTTEKDRASEASWGQLTRDQKFELRRPSTVLSRGMAVCGGFASVEQYYAENLGKNYGFSCLKVDGYSRPVLGDSVASSGKVDHAWTTYLFDNGKLWASSDSTTISNIIRQFRNGVAPSLERGLPTNLMVCVDPLLRDTFNILRYPTSYESSYKVHIAKGAPDCTLFNLDTWHQLSQTVHSACMKAKQIARSAQPL